MFKMFGILPLGTSLRYCPHDVSSLQESKTDEERENDGLDEKSCPKTPRHVTEKKIPSTQSALPSPAQQASFDLGGILHLKR